MQHTTSDGVKIWALQHLHTGNVIFDMLVCMAIPILLATLRDVWFPQLKALCKQIFAYVFRTTVSSTASEVVRTITFEYFARDGISRAVLPCMQAHNDQLYRAIIIYLNSLGLSYAAANVTLMASYNAKNTYDEDGYNYAAQQPKKQRLTFEEKTKEKLNKYSITTTAPDNVWVELGDHHPGVSVMFQTEHKKKNGSNSGDGGGGGDGGSWFQNNDDDDDDNNGGGRGSRQQQQQPQSTIFSILVRARFSEGNTDEQAEAEARVKTLIEKAHVCYIEQTTDRADVRYLFMVQKVLCDSSSNTTNLTHHICERSVLTNNKQFKDIFFQSKKNLVSLLTDFQERTGRYAIAGAKHTLGILLRGPPGCGKTSIIKAVAHMTNRHIVSIPLANLRTNNDFSSFFKALHYAPQQSERNNWHSTSLGYNDVVFVLEEADILEVLHQRKLPNQKQRAQDTDQAEQNNNNDGSNQASGDWGHDTDGDSDCSNQRRSKRDTLSDINSDDSDDEQHQQQEEQATHKGQSTNLKELLAAALLQGNSSNNNIDPALGAALLQQLQHASGDGKNSRGNNYNTKGKGHMFEFFCRQRNGDQPLTLDTILNVLDGIVEMPGRLLIVTSNYPEKLDSAFLRPGRIDMQLYLGAVCTDTACEMLQVKYNTAVTDDQRKRVANVIARAKEHHHRLSAANRPSKGASPTTAKAKKKKKSKGHLITPACLEQWCYEHDNIDQLIAMLERKFKE